MSLNKTVDFASCDVYVIAIPLLQQIIGVGCLLMLLLLFFPTIAILFANDRSKSLREHEIHYMPYPV